MQILDHMNQPRLLMWTLFDPILCAEAWLSPVSSSYCTRFKSQLYMGQGIQESMSENLLKTVFRKNEVIWSAQADHITSNLSKPVYDKFYQVHFQIP